MNAAPALLPLPPRLEYRWDEGALRRLLVANLCIDSMIEKVNAYRGVMGVKEKKLLDEGDPDKTESELKHNSERGRKLKALCVYFGVVVAGQHPEAPGHAAAAANAGNAAAAENAAAGNVAAGNAAAGNEAARGVVHVGGAVMELRQVREQIVKEKKRAAARSKRAEKEKADREEREAKAKTEEQANVKVEVKAEGTAAGACPSGDPSSLLSSFSSSIVVSSLEAIVCHIVAPPLSCLDDSHS